MSRFKDTTVTVIPPVHTLGMLSQAEAWSKAWASRCSPIWQITQHIFPTRNTKILGMNCMNPEPALLKALHAFSVSPKGCCLCNMGISPTPS